MQLSNKNPNVGILLIRITISSLMLLHGITKLDAEVGGIVGLVTSKGLPGFLAYGAIAGEVIAPLMILIGFRTRLAAVVYALNCVAAILLAHCADLVSLKEYGGWAAELLGLYLFSSVALYFTGSGRYAVSTSSAWD